jgi:hypothetical protein
MDEPRKKRDKFDTVAFDLVQAYVLLRRAIFRASLNVCGLLA